MAGLTETSSSGVLAGEQSAWSIQVTTPDVLAAQDVRIAAPDDEDGDDRHGKWNALRNLQPVSLAERAAAGKTLMRAVPLCGKGCPGRTLTKRSAKFRPTPRYRK